MSNFGRRWWCRYCRMSDRHNETETDTKRDLKERITETHIHKGDERLGVLRGTGVRVEVGNGA